MFEKCDEGVNSRELADSEMQGSVSVRLTKNRLLLEADSSPEATKSKGVTPPRLTYVVKLCTVRFVGST